MEIDDVHPDLGRQARHAGGHRHHAGRRRALLPPLLWVVSATLLAARITFDSDTFRHCRYLGPSPRMYVTS
ncbi:hypothetical protein ABZ934_01890 [Streptomyces sp. NPDC046557]|uniref:hypothetical protein n=1 Tax=Streptomyces sp. NPDC046557 TaxID=3155372 RepID=UPI0033DE5F2D